MTAPVIAIVGSYDPQREKELELRNLALGPKAGEDLGKMLAAQGFQIVVYASYPHMLEIDVVRGYCSVKNAQPGSIHVYYSHKSPRPSFQEENANSELFKFVPDSREDWEVSFYHSLSAVDGAIILGGGRSTLIGGLVAIGHKKPILACAGFGGSGQKIWEVLPTQDYPLTLEEKSLMADDRWSEQRAERLITILKNQIERKKREEEARLQAERDSVLQKIEEAAKKDKNITVHALVAAGVFILSVVMWPIAWGVQGLNDFWLWTLLIGTPLLSGISGATIRVVFDWMQGTSKLRQLSLARNAALGLVIGGITAILFITAQVFSNPAVVEQTIKSESLRRLLPFTLSIGFIAGLTLDLVYSKLRETNIVDTSAIKPTEKPKDGD